MFILNLYLLDENDPCSTTNHLLSTNRTLPSLHRTTFLFIEDTEPNPVSKLSSTGTARSHSGGTADRPTRHSWPRLPSNNTCGDSAGRRPCPGWGGQRGGQRGRCGERGRMRPRGRAVGQLWCYARPVTAAGSQRPGDRPLGGGP